MRETLEFIFSSFWVWLGTLVLVIAFGEALRGAIRVCAKDRS